MGLWLEAAYFNTRIYTKTHGGRLMLPKLTRSTTSAYFCISKRWASSQQDVRAYRGADVGSDHMLLVAQVKLKLKRIVKKQRLVQPDHNNLKDSKFYKQFQLELSNRFSVLQTARHGWRSRADVDLMEVYNERCSFKGIGSKTWVLERTLDQ